MDQLLSGHTPIEEFYINRKRIFVKRDDLFCHWPAPPLAKLRGLRLLLDRFYKEGVRLIGYWDTRISQIGQGLAAYCREYPGMRCIVSYSAIKEEGEPEAIRNARRLGAEIYLIPDFEMSTCYAKVESYVTTRGGIMLPIGLECAETVEGVEREAMTVPLEVISDGTLVVSCGSGISLVGIISGLTTLPHRMIGVACGKPRDYVLTCVGRYIKHIPKCLEVHESGMNHSYALTFPCPFPSHPNYDLKAWKFLVDNVQYLREPILFWNIGAQTAQSAL